MRIIKKINIISIFALTLFLLISLPVNIFASANSYSNFGATYKVTEVVEERDLGYGVKYHRELSTLTTDISGISVNVSIGVEAKQQVNVLEIEPSKDVQLVPYAYLEGSNWIATSVRKAAAQYELKNPGYKVLAAVNGDFFAINDAMKASTGVTISQGEYYKTVSGHGGVNTLGIRNTSEGKQLFTTKIKTSVPMLSIYDENDNIIQKIKIDVVNQEPGDNQISLYYPDRVKSFSDKVTPITVNNVYYIKRSIYSVSTQKGSFYGVGVITDFSTENIELLQSQFAIKSNNAEVNALLGKDVKIRCQYEYDDPSLEGVENFIGFPYQIITNSEPWKEVQNNRDNAMYRHPRTIIGQKENGEIVLVTVDGRQTPNMAGATSVEMSAIMAYYDCVDAWNLDGGGSTTMIIRKQNGWDFEGKFHDDSNDWHIMNSPSDGGERSDGNHLFVVVKAPQFSIDIAELTETGITLNIALLTDVEKYKELYVLMNDKFYPINDGSVTIKGLKKNTEYVVEIYSKDGDRMWDLMTLYRFKTTKPAPTSVEIQASIFEKNGTQYISLKYKADKNDALKSIVLVADKEYFTAGETVLIEQTQEFYDALLNGKIEVTYNTHDMFEDAVLIIDDLKISFDLSYIFTELEFTINNIMTDVFN